MLTTLAALLGNSAIGSLVGWLGGAMNRWIDLKNRDKDIETLRINHQHELDKMDKDREFMKEEWAQRLQVAQSETERAVETAAYETMLASYGADKAAYGGGFVDAVRGLMRPVLTLLTFTLACTLAGLVTQFAYEHGFSFTKDELSKLFQYCVHWALFQSAVCVGWWFANRPGYQIPRSKP